MNLTAREKDKLLISMAAMVARRRLERGVKLNYPEAVALISDFVVEGARDGRTVADLMEAGAHVVARDQVSVQPLDRHVMEPGEAVLPQAGRADVYLTAVGVVLTLVYLFGLLFRPRKQILRMGVDSLVVLIVYIVSVGGLIAITAGGCISVP